MLSSFVNITFINHPVRILDIVYHNGSCLNVGIYFTVFWVCSQKSYFKFLFLLTIQKGKLFKSNGIW